MNCDRVQVLFGAYWDDETTQAEREHLEAHFTVCERCRTEYETFSRALELTAALPRVEAAPDLLERVLARTRRTAAAPDHVLQPRPRWQVAGAVAALLVVGAAVLLPSLRGGPPSDRAGRVSLPPVREPVLVAPAANSALNAPALNRFARSLPGVPGSGLALLADSVFDHKEDVEFILDPVTLRRGHAHAVTSAPAGVRVERAVVSF